MKNFLLFPDCFTEEDIHHCQFALLKFLGVYNLTPPANISVIIHTSKAAAFEIFQSFFPQIQIQEKTGPLAWNDAAGLRQLLSDCTGNVLVCRPHAYLKKEAEALMEQMAAGSLLYCLQPYTGTTLPHDHFFDKVLVAGISTKLLQHPSTSLYTNAQNISHYFAVYKSRKKVDTLLKLFFRKNEEESLTNLVKKSRTIDLEALEKEAADTDQLPFIKRWLRRITGKNKLLQQYRNKL